MRKLLTIGEVSRLVNMTTSQIRFYERKGLLKPSKIEENGYRLYSFEEIDKLEAISLLRDLNMSIDEIKKQLSAEADYNYQQTLQESRNSLIKDISRLKNRLTRVEGLMKLYESFESASAKVIHCPERELSIINDDKVFELSERQLYEFIVHYNLDFMSYNNDLVTLKVADGTSFFCLYDKSNLEVNDLFPKYKLEAGAYFSLGTSVRDFSEMNGAFEEFENLAQKEGYRLTGEDIIIEDLNTVIYSKKLIYVTFQKRIVSN